MKVPWFHAAALLLSFACKREAPEASPTDVSSAAAAVAAPSAAASAARPWFAGKWNGTYDAVPNPPAPAPGAPREWSKDDGKSGAGKGTLELSIDDHGIATGRADGALGAQAVSGTADGETLRLALTPTELADLKAFRGAVVFLREGDVLRGTLRAGSGDGATLRRADIELRRQPGP